MLGKVLRSKRTSPPSLTLLWMFSEFPPSQVEDCLGTFFAQRSFSFPMVALLRSSPPSEALNLPMKYGSTLSPLTLPKEVANLTKLNFELEEPAARIRTPTQSQPR